MTQMHITKLGNSEGTPLVMLHGWGQSHRDLLPLGELLAKERCVYLIDLPGFGASEAPPKHWSGSDYALSIKNKMDELSIESADFFGHSFGGKIAVTFADSFPEKIRRLVLLNSSGIPPIRRTRQRVIGLLGKLVKGIDRILKTDLFPSYFTPRFASADYKNAGVMRPVLVRSIRENISSKATSLKIKTLLIWGEKDTETPLYMGKKLHQLMTNSRLLVLEGKGHSPFLGAGYHLLTKYMEPFLQ